MSDRRNNAIRGSRIRSQSGDPKLDVSPAPEDVVDPTIPREFIDHALERKQAIYEIRRTGGFHFDGNDTDPYLLRAAAHYGVETDRDCPICTKTKLSELTYVYSKELGYFSGRIYSRTELPSIARQYGFLRVFHVEVCQGCGWNHVLTSYVLGDGQPRKPLRKPRDLVD
ncbi:MAG: hypothetical protein RIS43_204 [Actinomycetota bacterium]|jgi:hypothetical protein